MRALLAKALHALAAWISAKALPPLPVSGIADDFRDQFRAGRPPNARELLRELRNTAYTCAALNAAVCAAHPPRLYVGTSPGQPPPRCHTKAVAPRTAAWLRSAPHLAGYAQATVIEEVTEHPLLALFRTVNEEHNHWDLWELTTLYQEVTGSAYWLLEFGPLGVPQRIWPLPSPCVRPVRVAGSGNVVDYYEYRQGSRLVRYAADEVIHFKYPDPNDPYGPGLSPLRACFEHVLFDGEYLALKRAKVVNQALPSVLISPAETPLNPIEAQRLEALWNRQLREGGQGRALVSEAKLHVNILSQALGDLSALAEVGASKEVIANAFGVPAPYLFRETNLANLQAAETLHAALTVRPRLMRRDEKLNERLVPLFDPSGRLFLASDDPRPADKDRLLRQQTAHVTTGLRTINEVRAEMGLGPVPWGDGPPAHLRPPDDS